MSKDFNGAASAAKHGLTLKPDDDDAVDLQYLAALAYANMKQIDEAKTYYDEGVEFSKVAVGQKAIREDLRQRVAAAIAAAEKAGD